MCCLFMSEFYVGKVSMIDILIFGKVDGGDGVREIDCFRRFNLMLLMKCLLRENVVVFVVGYCVSKKCE